MRLAAERAGEAGLFGAGALAVVLVASLPVGLVAAALTATSDAHVWPAATVSLGVASLAVLLAAPVGLWLAVQLAFVAPAATARRIRFGVELFGDLPAVLLGAAAAVTSAAVLGDGVVHAAVVLAVLVVPVVCAEAEAALREVPVRRVESALALGVSWRRALLDVVLPEVRAGLVAALLRGLARAIGDTMVVLLVLRELTPLSVHLLRSEAPNSALAVLGGISVVLATIAVALRR